MNYTNLPIYIKKEFIGSSQELSLDQFDYLLALDASINLQSQSIARRKLGKYIDQSYQLNVIDNIQAKISFSSYISLKENAFVGSLIKACSPYSYIIRIGSNDYKGCYLESFSIDFQPFNPVKITANFMVNNSPSDEPIISKSESSTTVANEIVQTNDCLFYNTSQATNNTQSSIKYTVNCQRSTSNTLGSVNGTKIFLNSIERQLDISSTNLSSLINFSGSKLNNDMIITIKDQTDSFQFPIIMNRGSTVYSQQINIQEFETLSTQASIRQIVV